MPHHPLLSSALALPLLVIVLVACGSSDPEAQSDQASAAQARVVAVPTEPTLAPPLAGSYAALGASETYGVGAQPHTMGYAYQLARALHASHFVDEGIPGTTLNAAYDTELTNALTIRPYLCTVFFGYNDLSNGVSRAAFLQDLHDLVATLRRARSRVLVIGMPDLARLPAVASHHILRLRAIVISWNRGMAQVARQTGARFLDLYSLSGQLLAHPEYISADGLHPSNAGYARLTRILLTTVRRDRLWSTR